MACACQHSQQCILSRSCCVQDVYRECSNVANVLQEWPELGGGPASHAGHQSSTSTEQPATPALASEPSHANGHQPDSSNSPLTTSTPKADMANRSTAKAGSGSSSSPDQRPPSTPSPANSHPHSPETPLSGQTTATTSSAGTPPAALQSQQQQQQHTTHAAQQHRHDALNGSHAVARQAGSEQQQQGLVQLPVISSSDVQRDPIVQLASRRNSGRVPPPGFSGPVAAPSSAAAPSSQGPRHKVCLLCNIFSEACRLWVLSRLADSFGCTICLCCNCRASFQAIAWSL